MLGNLRVWPISRTESGWVQKLIDRERITIFFGFPDVYLRMYEEGLDAYDLSSVQVWIATADTSHEVHKRAFCRKGALLRLRGRPLLGSLFLDVLGTSEVGWGALSRFTSSCSKPRHDRLVGRPSYLAGPKVKIADETGRRLPPGTVGHLMVKGPTLFKGYWNAREQPRRPDGWWWTGDIGYQDRFGRVYHMDRAVDVIRTRDGPVYTLLAEEVLMSHPDVSEAAVFGVTDPLGEEVPVALVYPKAGHTIDSEACRAWVNGRLQRSAGLRQLAVVSPDDIPRGLTGKVLKRVLRARYQSRFFEDVSTIPTILEHESKRQLS
jgi:acyl-coenzyme A synthetase/AMP-(fatty) acid ligase